MTSEHIDDKLMSSRSSSESDDSIRCTIHLSLPNVHWTDFAITEEGRFRSPDTHGVDFSSNLPLAAPLSGSSHSTSNMSLPDQVPNSLCDGNHVNVT